MINYEMGLEGNDPGRVIANYIKIIERISPVEEAPNTLKSHVNRIYLRHLNAYIDIFYLQKKQMLCSNYDRIELLVEHSINEKERGDRAYLIMTESSCWISVLALSFLLLNRGNFLYSRARFSGDRKSVSQYYLKHTEKEG